MIFAFRTAQWEFGMATASRDVQALVAFLDERARALAAAKDEDVSVMLWPETSAERKAMLKEFVRQSELGEVNPILIKFAESIFRSALTVPQNQAASADRLLGLRESTKHRPPRNRERDWQLCNRVAELSKGGEGSVTSALEKVADEFRMQFEGAKKIYYRTKDTYLDF